MMVSLEFVSWLVKVDCPITSRAACPVTNFWAKRAATQRRNTEIHFMRNVYGCVSILKINHKYSKGLRPHGGARTPHPCAKTARSAAVRLKKNSLFRKPREARSLCLHGGCHRGGRAARRRTKLPALRCPQKL